VRHSYQHPHIATDFYIVPGSGPYGNYSLIAGDCWSAQQSNGTFTNCPDHDQTGNLLRTVATASYPNDLPILRKKWDNTRFSFIGRSYGVGSSAGLTDRNITSLGNVDSYVYHENGFLSEARCTYNQTSALEIRLVKTNLDTLPNLYLAIGALPNSNWTNIYDYTGIKLYGSGYDFYAQVAFENNNSIVSTFQRGPINDDDRWMFGMVAGKDYRQLQNTQCQIKFTPSVFSVNVSMTDSTIKVSPIPSMVVSDPDPGMQLRRQALKSYGLSFTTTSLYGSAVGNAFLENIRSLQARKAFGTSLDDPAYKSVVLESVADSLTAVMDDALVALGSISLTMSNATQTVPANATILAVKIGTKPLIWSVLLVNLSGLVTVLVGLFLLRQADVPVFDFCDLGCMAFGIIDGAVVLTPDDRDVSIEDTRWDGDARDERVGELRARLIQHVEDDE
jgi:hypothetical protein